MAVLGLRQTRKWEHLIIINNHKLQSQELFQNRYKLFCNFSAQPELSMIWLHKDCLVSETRACTSMPLEEVGSFPHLSLLYLQEL